MKGRFPALLMSLVALALVLGLVVTLAPDAGAQDSATTPNLPAKWMRHNMPVTNDVEAATRAAIPLGVIQKTCCITIVPGSQPGPDTVSSESAAGTQVTQVIFDGEVSRWFCAGPQD